MFPRYKENTKKLAKLALDQPMTGIEKVVWWTEYVIRNGGAQHLRNPAADLPWYQYYLLDVAAACLAFIVVVFIILIALCRILRTLFIRSWKIVRNVSSSAALVEASSNNQRVSKRSKKSKTS